MTTSQLQALVEAQDQYIELLRKELNEAGKFGYKPAIYSLHKLSEAVENIKRQAIPQPTSTDEHSDYVMD